MLRVHADLVKMKNNFEKMGYKQEFERYYLLHINPGHIHKSKNEHEKAIFTLSSALSMIVAEENAIYQATKVIEERKKNKEQSDTFFDILNEK